MGKTRIIAETGAGQHGVATATVCARFGLPCVIYMGAKDVERQQPNVFRMKLLGAEVIPVTSGANTLKDAMNEALRDWVANVHDTFYIIGTAAGPHPYPELVRDFQSVIGKEARAQMLEPHRPPARSAGRGDRRRIERDRPVPPVPRRSGRQDARRRSGGPRARQAACREPRRRSPRHPPRQQDLPAAGRGRPDHRSPFDQRGLDYPGIGPEHRLAEGNRPGRLHRDHRQRGARRLPAAVPHRRHHPRARTEPRDRRRGQGRADDGRRMQIILANLCGRGDKDIFTVAEALGAKI